MVGKVPCGLLWVAGRVFDMIDTAIGSNMVRCN